jgi:hypothetical protein
MEKVLYLLLCLSNILFGADDYRDILRNSSINGDPDESTPLLAAPKKELVQFMLTNVQHPQGGMCYAINCDLELGEEDPYVKESYRVLRQKQITEKRLPWVLLAIHSWGPTQVLFKPDDLPKIQCHDLYSILTFMKEDGSLLPLINGDEVWGTLWRICRERIGPFRIGRFQTFIFDYKGKELSDSVISKEGDTILAALLRRSVYDDPDALKKIADSHAEMLCAEDTEQANELQEETLFWRGLCSR